MIPERSTGPLISNFFVEKLEGKEEEAVAESEEQLRAAVKAVVHCDMTQD